MSCQWLPLVTIGLLYAYFNVSAAFIPIIQDVLLSKVCAFPTVSALSTVMEDLTQRLFLPMSLDTSKSALAATGVCCKTSFHASLFLFSRFPFTFSLGLFHDGHPTEARGCPYKDGYLMAPSTGDAKRIWRFSPCSRTHLRRYLRWAAHLARFLSLKTMRSHVYPQMTHSGRQSL